MSGLEPPYAAIWDLLKQGQIIPFLGAGASLAASDSTAWEGEHPTRLPRGGELGRYLAQHVNFPPEEGTDDLAKVAQYYRVIMGRARLRERLHQVFAHEYAHSTLHNFLAGVPSNLLIITTNYDDLIERAFKAKERPFDLVVHPTDNAEWAAAVIHWKADAQEPEFISPKKLRIDLATTTVIYKMHGAVDRQAPERDSFVITEDDYADFIVRMAKQSAIPAVFAEPMRTRHFLFLGYSLRDWNLRVILSKIEKDLARTKAEELPSWAIQYQPSLLEQELWNKRGVKIYDMTIQEFVQKLALEQGR